MVKHESDVAIERIKYERALTQFQVTPKSTQAQQELSQYYTLVGKLTGIDISLADVEASQVLSMRRRYEEATGYKFGSPELEAAIDRTIAHM
jgi:hypothetical protein